MRGHEQTDRHAIHAHEPLFSSGGKTRSVLCHAHIINTTANKRQRVVAARGANPLDFRGNTDTAESYSVTQRVEVMKPSSACGEAQNRKKSQIFEQVTM